MAECIWAHRSWKPKCPGFTDACLAPKAKLRLNAWIWYVDSQSETDLYHYKIANRHNIAHLQAMVIKRPQQEVRIFVVQSYGFV